jgi:hypothetical protein
MYEKSILRSLILDGGIAITDPVRLRDLLHEQAQVSQQIQMFGTVGGGMAIGLGVLMMSINPGSLLATVTGAYALYLGQRNKPTPAEEKEFRFLSRHGRILNLMGEFAKAGKATGDEILSAYESLTRSYLPITDQIVVNGEAIAAGEMMAQLPQVIAAQRQTPEPAHCNALPVPSRKTIFPPSRLAEYTNAAPTLPPAFDGALGAATSMDQQQTVDASPVATLNRTLTQQAPIGLPPALREMAVDNPYSHFFFGQSEAGKDITLYNVIAELKAKFSTALFVGIDGKNIATESPLWDIYDRTLRISMLDKPRDYHRKLLELLDAACRWQGMVFVAFSELNAIASSYETAKMTAEWGEIAHLVKYLAIQGNGAGKYLYASAQALNLDALGISKESRANCRFVAIANATQFNFMEQIAGDTKVFKNETILNQQTFYAACSRSTALEHLNGVRDTLKGIAWFHSSLNRWEPMTRLQNPAVDRCLALSQAPPPGVHQFAIPDPLPPPVVADCDLDASIEVETLFDVAMEMLYSNPGVEFALTKLCGNRSERSKYGEFLIEILQESPNVTYRIKKHAQVTSHLFSWNLPKPPSNDDSSPVQSPRA